MNKNENTDQVDLVCPQQQQQQPPPPPIANGLSGKSSAAAASNGSLQQQQQQEQEHYIIYSVSNSLKFELEPERRAGRGRRTGNTYCWARSRVSNINQALGLLARERLKLYSSGSRTHTQIGRR